MYHKKIQDLAVEMFKVKNALAAEIVKYKFSIESDKITIIFEIKLISDQTNSNENCLSRQ